MSANDVSVYAEASVDSIQYSSADGSVEIDAIASASDGKSADKNAASYGVLLGEEEGSVCDGRRQESDGERVKETSALESTQESGCKRKRDSDDVGKTSNRDKPEPEDWLYKGAVDHTCWIKKSHAFRAKQIKLIRAKHDASKLFRCMNDNIKYLHNDDSVCYHRWWLATATQYNHVGLVSLILADRKRSDHNDEANVRGYAMHSEDRCQFGKPFYMAIEKGLQSLVQVFLHAGESVTDSQDALEIDPFGNIRASLVASWQFDSSDESETDPYDGSETAHQRPPRYDRHRVQDIACLEHIHEHVSAVEYACIVNQPEVLKLLVAHFNCQHPERNHTDTSLTSNQPAPRERITRPLHLIMKLTTQFYGPHLNQLPALVQLVINTGGDVDCVDEQGYSPLQVLIRKIRFIAPLDEEGRAYRSAIIEIMKILLTAGTKAITTQLGHTPLRLLSHLIFPYNHPEFHGYNDRNVPFACALRDNFNFVGDLARLLLLNGADLTAFRFHEQIPYAACMILNDFGRNGPKNGFTDEILDSLSNLFHSAQLAEANRPTVHAWKQFMNNSCNNYAILKIANHSFQPGRSEKLIYRILEALGTSNLKELRYQWQRHQFLKEYMTKAINYVNVVLSDACAPRSLQDLSRDAILRAMSARALRPYASVELGLPPLLKAFVLPQLAQREVM